MSHVVVASGRGCGVSSWGASLPARKVAGRLAIRGAGGPDHVGQPVPRPKGDRPRPGAEITARLGLGLIEQPQTLGYRAVGTPSTPREKSTLAGWESGSDPGGLLLEQQRDRFNREALPHRYHVAGEIPDHGDIR